MHRLAKPHLLAVVYHAWNFLNDDQVAIKLEPLTSRPSSVEHEYKILKQLGNGVGIPHVIWFGRDLHTVVNIRDQLLSCLEYIHSYGYIHSDIKPQNILVGLGNSTQTLFVVDFGITKMYWNTATKTHIPFCRGHPLTGTPAFTSINNHLGLEPGCHDDLESFAYILIYFLLGSLPWLTSNHEKLSTFDILEHKVDTTIADLCDGSPSEFANILVYSWSLLFSEDPDYDYLRSLLRGLCTTEIGLLDFI
ncbi:casein kinase I isoform delta-like protein [Suillus occidentalis]|nr:casein kinase I isoform delta-like protein [Suillus occidentalis]